MNRFIFIQIVVVLNLFFTRPGLTDGGHVGSGGDSLRMVFNEARVDAAAKVLNLKACSFNKSERKDVTAWLLKNRMALSNDILKSPHSWNESEDQKTCGYTHRKRNSEISFSFPACIKNVTSSRWAAKVLVHESVHHFGFSDEAFADEVAFSFYRAKNDCNVGVPATQCPLVKGIFEDEKHLITQFDYVLSGKVIEYRVVDPAGNDVSVLTDNKKHFWPDFQNNNGIKYTHVNYIARCEQQVLFLDFDGEAYQPNSENSIGHAFIQWIAESSHTGDLRIALKGEFTTQGRSVPIAFPNDIEILKRVK